MKHSKDNTEIQTHRSAAQHQCSDYNKENYDFMILMHLKFEVNFYFKTNFGTTYHRFWLLSPSGCF